jgi:hypothetical protein
MYPQAQGLLTIVRGILSQANRFARAHTHDSGHFETYTARLGGFISFRSPGKVNAQRDGDQPLFEALIDSGR